MPTRSEITEVLTQIVLWLGLLFLILWLANKVAIIVNHWGVPTCG